MRGAIAGTGTTGFSQCFRVMCRAAWLACGLMVLGPCVGPAAALAGVGEPPLERDQFKWKQIPSRPAPESLLVAHHKGSLLLVDHHKGSLLSVDHHRGSFLSVARSDGKPDSTFPDRALPHAAAPTPQGGCCAPLLADASSQPEPSRYRLAQLSQRPETDATLYVTPAVPTRMGLEKLAGPAGQYKFIIVKGLPPGFVISEGFATANAWVVSMQDVGNLTITTPDGFRGTVALTLVLYKGQDGQTDQRTLAVSNRPRPQEAATLPDALPTSAPAALSAPALPAAEENALMTRAADLMQRGDVAAARLLYQSLAAKGSAQAAFAMGRSYDPDLLKGDALRRLADIEQARTWYRKATQLGSREAEVRLSTLR